MDDFRKFVGVGCIDSTSLPVYLTMDDATKSSMLSSDEIMSRIVALGDGKLDFNTVSVEIESLCAQRDRLLAKLAGFYTDGIAREIAEGVFR